MMDKYQKLRYALSQNPTPGPWEVINGTDVFTPLGARNAAGVEAAADDGWHVADCDMGPSFTEEGKEEKISYEEQRANAGFIAACDPDTIRALLEERDALREALKVLVNWTPSADTYRRLGFNPEAPMRAHEAAKAALTKGNSND